MSTVPVVCPHCYKNLHSPVTGPDGLVRCDACGHAFPPGGSSLSYSSGSFGAPPKGANSGPTASYGSYPANFGNAGQTYPPASGPQNPSGPGMFTCAVVVGLGALALSCCGCFGAYLLLSVQRNPAAPPGFNQPFNNPPVIKPPKIPEPVFTPPPFGTPPLGQPPGVPGASAARTRSLDEVLQAIKSANAADFSTTALLDELYKLPVDESRRGEVVGGVLKYLEGAKTWACVSGGQVLEKWATKAEANQLAKFAAGEFDEELRKVSLGVIRQTGGDAETAKMIAPLLDHWLLRVSAKETLETLGPVAEDAVLGNLRRVGFHARIESYRLLGRIGTEKSVAVLRPIAEKKSPTDPPLVARQAIAEIEQRLRENP